MPPAQACITSSHRAAVCLAALIAGSATTCQAVPGVLYPCSRSNDAGFGVWGLLRLFETGLTAADQCAIAWRPCCESFGLWFCCTAFIGPLCGCVQRTTYRLSPGYTRADVCVRHLCTQHVKVSQAVPGGVFVTHTSVSACPIGQALRYRTPPVSCCWATAQLVAGSRC